MHLLTIYFICIYVRKERGSKYSNTYMGSLRLGRCTPNSHKIEL